MAADKFAYKTKQARGLTAYLNWVIAAVVVLLPFHAFFTTWLGSNLGFIDFFRVWKELLILFLCFGSGYLLIRSQPLRQKLLSDPIIIFIAGFTTLYIIFGIFALKASSANNEALLFSWIINLRFLAFFVVVGIIAAHSDWLSRRWLKLLIWPAVIVIAFGILQQVLLPGDFLRHFGYGPDTVPAFQSVDQKPDYIRLQSTLRGPNPLGAYLVLILLILTAYIVRHRKNYKAVGLLASGLVVLVFTYSRSAWLGLFIGCCLIAAWLLTRKKAGRWLAAVTIGGLIVLGGVVWVLRDNNVVQNTLFHTDETSHSAASSNQERTQAISSGIKDIVNEPGGRGPGTAGPASSRNSKPARIAENYYLQIGQEVGIIGVILFAAINILVAFILWQQRKVNYLALPLLASLAGLTAVNLLSHAWTDDTLSLLWWGSAGLVWGSANSGILKTSKPKSK